MRQPKRHFPLLLLGCLLLGFGGTGACTKKAAEEDAVQQYPVASVQVAEVRGQPIQHRDEASGTVEAIRRATIAAKVTGTIVNLPVVLGSVVKKDDLLVEISAEEINARMARAKAQLEEARRNFEREERLLRKQASTEQTVKSLQDAVRVAEAAYREARTMSGYTTISAPFGGVISEKNVQAGDLATPGAPLLTLEDNRKLQVVASIPEATALRLRAGDQLPVRVAAAEFDRTGVVAEIAPSANPISRTTTVKLHIEDTASLRPGQYVRVGLPGASVETLLVPRAAVNRYGQMERLFVVENGKARLRLVRTGEQRGDQVEILAGLDKGEHVVIQGNDHLHDGQPVRIMQP